jgi:hypothetical protein
MHSLIMVILYFLLHTQLYETIFVGLLTVGTNITHRYKTLRYSRRMHIERKIILHGAQTVYAQSTILLCVPSKQNFILKGAQIISVAGWYSKGSDYASKKIMQYLSFSLFSNNNVIIIIVVLEVIII